MRAGLARGSMGEHRTDPRSAGYPWELETDLTLADGRTVHVRPILPCDAPALRAAIEQADEETIRLRFLAVRPNVTDQLLRHLTVLDYDKRLALVAFDSGVAGVAVARYEGEPGRAEAEVAVAVAPGWRKVGLATRLLTLLGRAAIARGIGHFTATYYARNRPVRDLVGEFGLLTRRRTDAGVVEEEIDLPALGDPRPGSHP